MIRITRSGEEKSVMEKFFDTQFLNLPFDREIMTNAMSIYPLFNFCKSVGNKGQVAIVDTLNMSYLKRYQQGLLLITLDHNDYPKEFFCRLGVGAIDLETDIIAWGIYQFNERGFQDMIQRFQNKKTR
jgi:hypothetical protein